MILHQTVRVHDIGTNLVSKAYIFNLASNTRHLLRLLLLHHQIQLCFEHLHCLILIVVL